MEGAGIEKIEKIERREKGVERRVMIDEVTNKFAKGIAQGNEEIKNNFLTELNKYYSINPLGVEDFVKKVKEKYYEYFNLKGLYTRKLGKEGLKGVKLEMVFHAIDNHPLGRDINEKFMFTMQDIGIPQSDWKKIAKSYEEYLNSKRKIELMLPAGLGTIFASFLAPRGAGRGALLGIGGIITLASELIREPPSPYSIDKLTSLSHLIPTVLGVGAIILASRKLPTGKIPKMEDIHNTLNYAIMKEGINFSGIDLREVEEISKRLNQNPYKTIAEIVSDKQNVNTLLASEIYFQKLKEMFLSMEDVLKSGMKKYIKGENLSEKELSAWKAFREIRDPLRIFNLFYAHKEAGFKNVELIVPIAKEDAGYLKLLGLGGKPTTFTADDGVARMGLSFQYSIDELIPLLNLRNEVANYGYILRFSDRVRKVGDEIKVEPITKQFTFRKDYIPTYSKMFYVEYEIGGDRINEIVSEFHLKDLVERIKEEGGRVVKVKGNFSAVPKLKDDIMDLVQQAIDGNITQDELQNALKDLISKRVNEKVWDLKKTTDEGFFKEVPNLIKKGDWSESEVDRFLSVYLKRDFMRGYPIHLAKARRIIENTPGLDIIDKLFKAIEGDKSFLSKSQTIFRRLWLLFNVPVRALNTFLIPFNISSNILSQNISALDKGRILGTLMKGFFSELPRSKIDTKYLASGLDVLATGIRAPFEFVVNALKSSLQRSVNVGGREVPIYEFVFGRIPPQSLDDYLSAYLFGEGVYAKPAFTLTKIGSFVDEMSAFLTANYIPFYHSAKAVLRPLSFLGKKPLRAISSLGGVGMVSATYGILIGMKNVFPFSVIEIFDNVRDMTKKIFHEEKDFATETANENLLGLTFYILDALGRNEKERDVLKSGYLAGFLEHLLEKMVKSKEVKEGITRIFTGGGIIQQITGWRTTAGALSLPPIFDAPLVQLFLTYADNFSTVSKAIKDRIAGKEIVDKKYWLALEMTLQQMSGVIKRIQDNFLTSYNSIAYYDEENFRNALRNILFPKERYAEVPLGADITNVEGMRVMRENYYNFLANFAGSLQKLKDRGGISYVFSSIKKGMENVSKKLQKGENMEENMKNLIALYGLQKLAEGIIYDKPLDLDFDTIRNVIDVLPLTEKGKKEQIKNVLPYFKEIEKRVKVIYNLSM